MGGADCKRARRTGEHDSELGRTDSLGTWSKVSLASEDIEKLELTLRKPTPKSAMPRMRMLPRKSRRIPSQRCSVMVM